MPPVYIFDPSGDDKNEITLTQYEFVSEHKNNRRDIPTTVIIVRRRGTEFGFEIRNGLKHFFVRENAEAYVRAYLKDKHESAQRQMNKAIELLQNVDRMLQVIPGEKKGMAMQGYRYVGTLNKEDNDGLEHVVHILTESEQIELPNLLKLSVSIIVNTPLELDAIQFYWIDLLCDEMVKRVDGTWYAREVEEVLAKNPVVKSFRETDAKYLQVRSWYLSKRRPLDELQKSFEDYERAFYSGDNHRARLIRTNIMAILEVCIATGNAVEFVKARDAVRAARASSKATA